MSEQSDTTQASTDVQPQILPVYTGECFSLSGRSTVTFETGRLLGDEALHMRIASNSGTGMFCDEWVEGARIDAAVVGFNKLTAKSFHQLRPGKSINTAGFFLAILKELGLVKPNSENTRQHEHVPTMTFERVVIDAMEKADSAKRTKARKRIKEE